MSGKSLIGAVVVGLFSAGTVWAVALTPGNTVSLPGNQYPVRTAVEDVDRQVDLYTSSNVYVQTVTIRDRVTQMADGSYGFEPFLLNGSATSGNVNLVRYSLSDAGFAGFSTDVDYDNTSITGSVTPNEYPVQATRSADGNTVRFNDPFQLSDSLAAGQQTDFMDIETNARDYDLVGTITVTGDATGVGLVSGSVKVFAPIVPEPGSAGLLALIAPIAMRRRR